MGVPGSKEPETGPGRHPREARLAGIHAARAAAGGKGGGPGEPLIPPGGCLGISPGVQQFEIGGKSLPAIENCKKIRNTIRSKNCKCVKKITE